MSVLHLHVGLPKCGSTALQKYFRDNRAALLAQGVDYPALSPGHAGNLTPYAFSFRPPEARRWFHQTYPSYDISKAETDLRAALAAPKAPRLLLSSEALIKQSHGVDIDWMAEHFDAVHVHIFFRPRAPLLMSAYEQLLRGGHEQDDVTGFLDRSLQMPEMQLAAYLARWQAFAGKDRTHIYFISNDRPTIERQFLTVLGIDPATMPKPVSRANQAKSAFVHCVLAHASRRNLISTVQQKQRLFAIAAQYDPDPAARLLTPEIAHWIDAAYAEDTDRLLSMQQVMSRKDLETDPETLPRSTTFAEIEALPVFDAAMQQILADGALTQMPGQGA